MSRVSRCRSCKQEVDWAEFESSGKRASFDLEQASQQMGEVRWVLREEGGTTWATRAKDDEPGVTCHFATCPDADDWRKG